MKNQKFSNIYDLLDSKPKNISQLLGEFGEFNCTIHLYQLPMCPEVLLPILQIKK